LLIAGGAVVAGLLLVAMVVLLAMTWSELRTSRQHIASTDARVEALLHTTRPALSEVRPLVDDVQPVLNRAAPVLGRFLALAPRVDDVVSRLPAVISGVQGFVNIALPLAQDLGTSGLPTLVGDLRASDLPGLVDSLQGSDLPATTASLQQLISDLSAGDRLTRSLDATTSLLSEVQARGLPQKAVSSTRRLRDLLTTQRQAFQVLQQSLTIQRRTLSHTRSIDEKLGGQLPPVLGGLTSPQSP
jgi:hypothetical protein